MILSAPTLVTLYGEDEAESLGFAVTGVVAAKAAGKVLRIGSKLVKRIAARVRKRRKRKRAKAKAKRATAAETSRVAVIESGKGAARVVPAVTTNELYAARAGRKQYSPALILGGAGVVAVLLLSRKGGSR